MSDIFEMIGVLGGISVVVVATRAAWILLRRLEPGARKAGAAEMSSELHARLTEIERSTEAIALEIERLAEGQRFTARLLAERSPIAAPRLDAGRQSGRDAGRVNTPH